MKGLILIPLVTLLVAAAGYGLCRAVGGFAGQWEMTVAAAICIGSAEACLLVPLMVRSRTGGPRREPGTAGVQAVVQASLAATVLHVLLSLALGMVVVFGRVVGERNTFLFWLVGLFWTSMIALAVAVAGVIRQTSRERRSPGGPAGADGK